MQYKGFMLLLFLSLLWACQSDPKNDAGTTAATEEPAQDPKEALTTQRGTAAPAVNPGDSPFVQNLTSNFWVVEHWVNPQNDRATYLANKGRWWNFHPDGTFETGIWEEQTGQGTWRTYLREGEQVIFVDGESDVDDGEWKITFNGPVTQSSWVGYSDYPSSRGIMAKLDNLLTRPTKEQYGIQ